MERGHRERSKDEGFRASGKRTSETEEKSGTMKRSEVKVGHGDKTFDRTRDDAKQMDLETLSSRLVW
ncbi:hypothetical protein P170DRAFT_436033 [Aspergillus steynii IBT 23096]|uniref:Uncharacterized protein n=1 Tax=Aspergillus steynii IBT 23096 TaxID=1392250 RepID=A0A2I2GDR3_9EURO|nr:uncharacterized protein P170DRAFT_436033 [Aspergillus steynii IBT 23096]PLB50957.1 hypothetical protein P170DRAFT_436033 [Aspergillus steynii IBT 23096]